MNENQQPPQKPTKGYGKHSFWYWIIIYVVIAIVVYGLIYLLFFQSNTGSGGIKY